MTSYRIVATSVEHNRLHCRACGHALDHARGMSGKVVPRTGDFSGCFNCGEISVFEVGVFGVALREPSLEELQRFAQHHPDVVRSILLARGRRGGQ